MLEYFLSMFVDNSTRMLDPTCGSASALKACSKLGAKYALGLELNQDYYNSALKHLEDNNG